MRMKRKRALFFGLFISYAVIVYASMAVSHYVKTGIRQILFSELRPVKLANCNMKRFGASGDGGYLMCGNLLDTVQSAYSYGIEGRDEWGCDVSKDLHVPVHQYDCFNTTRPVCAGGEFIFHEECIGDAFAIIENRPYDTLAGHILKTNNSDKALVVKMDVEGSEWSSLLVTPDEILNHIEQLVVEFHQVEDKRYISLIRKLKRIFYIVNVHFNNYSCSEDKLPFPAAAYEVLFVNRRVGIIDKANAIPQLPQPLDAPNEPLINDCQAIW